MFNSTTDFTPPDDAIASQKSRLLSALLERADGVSTIYAREELGILSPASRVYDLRWKGGYLIETARYFSIDAQGRKHPNAMYTLRKGSL